MPIGLTIIFLAHVRFHFKIENHKEIRRRYKEITKRARPLLICSNHLTLIDSVIIMWGLASIPYYFYRYRIFCWNIPAIENFSTKLSWRLITYLNKCIPIDRQGSDEHKDEVLEKLRYLLRSNDTCMIFPEGTRSRTGVITPETVAYGIGRIMVDIPDCDVLCVYLRGRGQQTYSNFPKPDEQFYFDMELLTPKTAEIGRRAIRDYSVQVITKLKEMEDKYLGSSQVERQNQIAQ